MARMGRPPIFETVDDFEARNPDGFFEWCEENGHKPLWEWFGVYIKCLRDNNSKYIAQKLAEADGKWETLQQNKITEYENALGKTLSTAEADAEIYAEAIANELFSDYDSLQNLAAQNQSVFTKLKQWFYEKFIASGYEARGYSSSKKAARMTYALMIRAEKAALNGVQSDEGKRFMLSPTFANEFDLWVKNGAKDPRKTFDVGRTSSALKSIGLSDRPITWDSKKIITIIGDHPEMNLETLKKVPEILENPIVIMKSKQKTSRLTMFGEIISDGKPVLAVLELSPKDRQGFVLDEFKIVSSYGKDNAQSFINSSTIIYKDSDKKRISEWEKRTRLQLPVGDSNADSVISISDSAQNVNGNVSFAAKKPEIIDKLKADFGYSEASANNIYKAVNGLRKSAGSTADTAELSYAVATAIDNARKGKVDSGDIERITRLIAENSETENTEFVEEYKPIMDYLNKTKISISEADIADLGDTFLYQTIHQLLDYDFN